MGALNKAKIDRLTTKGRYADGDGLYLVVRESGTRAWILRTVVKGRRTDIGLGGLDTVSLADARELAAEKRKQAKAGSDPVHDKRKEKLTVEQAARAYYETLKPTFTSKRHSDQWIKSLENDVFPKFGKRLIADMTNVDVLKVLTPIWTEKPIAAKKIKQRMQSLFDWAYHAGHYSNANPVAAIQRALPKVSRDVKHFAAMPWQEVPAFYESAEHTIVKFLILTCVRSTECREAQWSEFDFENKVWTIPAERMKMGKEHRVPLTDEMIGVLESQKRLSATYVFPSLRKRGKSPVAQNYIIRLIEGNGFTAHGFRSSFKDWSIEAAHADDALSETVLAHAVGDSTRRAYARSDMFERRRKLMEQWAAFVTSKAVESDNVVQLFA
jgi:integrase